MRFSNYLNVILITLLRF